jgi:hypothetical protein
VQTLLVPYAGFTLNQWNWNCGTGISEWFFIF